MRRYIESARRPEVPPLTVQQTEALDLFDALAEDPAVNMQMTFRPGDMQWVHNHTMLHDRTAFEDWPEPERKRHLLRLWLAPLGARPLPAIYAERFGKVEIGDRGGIIVPGASLNAPLEAALRPLRRPPLSKLPEYEIYAIRYASRTSVRKRTCSSAATATR